MTDAGQPLLMLPAYPPILRIEKTAELLGVSENTVRRWAEEGAIPARKVGRCWLFSLRALVAFIEADQELLR